MDVGIAEYRLYKLYYEAYGFKKGAISALCVAGGDFMAV